MKETELNEVLNYMKQYVENKDEHDSEPMLNWKDLQLVLEGIERLNNEIKRQENVITELNDDNEYITDNINSLEVENTRLKSIIKEVREKADNFDVFKNFSFPLMKKWEEEQVKSSIDYEWRESVKKPILEILDKVEKENDIEFDVLKALNTDLDDDVEMG